MKRGEEYRSSHRGRSLKRGSTVLSTMSNDDSSLGSVLTITITQSLTVSGIFHRSIHDAEAEMLLL